MPRNGYDETAQLYRYLFFSYRKLFTESERDAELAIERPADVEEMVKQGKHFPPDHPLQTKLGPERVLEVEKHLADGIPAHQARVICRILELHKNRIVINRCPRCNCVVATPLAKQCLWCGHDWHHSDECYSFVD